MPEGWVYVVAHEGTKKKKKKKKKKKRSEGCFFSLVLTVEEMGTSPTQHWKDGTEVAYLKATKQRSGTNQYLSYGTVTCTTAVAIKPGGTDYRLHGDRSVRPLVGRGGRPWRHPEDKQDY